MNNTRLFSAEGTLDRGTYVRQMLLLIAVTFVFNLVIDLLPTGYPSPVAWVIPAVFFVACFLILTMGVIATIKRLRFVGMNPWFSVLLVVPIACAVLVIYLMLSKKQAYGVIRF